MIDGIPLLDIGQSGLLVFVVLLVLTDKLVWHKRLDKRDEQLATKDQHIAELTAQNRLLMESAIPTVNFVLGALAEASEERVQ